MIETKRVVRILTDLEGVYEDLLTLYEDLRQEGDPHDAAARRENLRLLGEYDEKLEVYEKAAEEMRAVIERITHVDTQREVHVSVPLDAETKSRVSQQLDRAQPHAIGEHFTFTKPLGFKLAGQPHAGIHTWTQLHQEVLAQLAYMDAERVARLPEVAEFARNLTSRFDRTPEGFRKPLRLPHGLFCEGHLSAGSIRDNIRRLLAHFGIPEREMVVYLREDREGE